MNKIENSILWKDIPNRYYMKCIEIKETKDGNKVLTFQYVAQLQRYDDFICKCGVSYVLKNAKGIILLRKDFLENPKVYFVEEDELYFAGILQNCPETKKEKVDFSGTFYFSGKNRGKEGMDNNAPDFLKELAKKHKANVAYFEF